jgi:hypothetical protein
MENNRIMKAIRIAARLRAAAGSEKNPERREVLLGRERRVLEGAGRILKVDFKTD